MNLPDFSLNVLNRDLIATITTRLCCPDCRCWQVHCPWSGEPLRGQLPGTAVPDFPVVLSSRSRGGATIVLHILGFELAGADEQPAIATPQGTRSVAALNRALQVPVWAPPAPPAPKLPRLLDLVEGGLRPCPPNQERFPLTAFGTVRFAPATVAGAYRRIFNAEPRRGTGVQRQTRFYSWREIDAVRHALTTAEKALAAMEARK